MITVLQLFKFKTKHTCIRGKLKQRLVIHRTLNWAPLASNTMLWLKLFSPFQTWPETCPDERNIEFRNVFILLWYSNSTCISFFFFVSKPLGILQVQYSLCCLWLFFWQVFFGCLMFITTAWQDQPVCQESMSVLTKFPLASLTQVWWNLEYL